MIHSTVNLPYVGGVATPRTTSSPSLNVGYVIWKYFLPSLVTWVSLWRFSLKWRLARMCLKTSILWQEGQEEGAMTWNGLSIRGFKTSQWPPGLNWLLDCMSPATLVITISSWTTISIVIAAYSSRVRHLLQNNCVETTGCQLSTNWYVVNSHEKPILIVKMYVGQ